MRIGGLSSGMDTESIVKNLMQTERLRINRFYQQEQKLKWRQEAYQDVNKKIANFILNSRKDLGLNQVSFTGEIYQSSVDRLSWVKSATSTNESVLTATAGSSTVNGTHSIDVKQLASNANVMSLNASENLGITDGGKIKITTSEKTGSFIEIDLSASSTMSSVVSEINSKGKDLGLTASYDRATQRLMITNKNAGSANFIDIEVLEDNEPENNLLSKLGLSSGKTLGKDAIISLNNGPDIHKDTNNFNVFGINLSLKSVSTTPVSVSVGINTEGIISKITNFVNQYNSLIDDITKQLNQEVYRNYQPLTKEQKESMSEKEIEKWEETAKSGLLRNDSIISKAIQTVRSSMYEKIQVGENQFIHLTDIGISTGNYQERGKLVINEDKLRKAIDEDPEKVMDIFFKTPPAQSTDKYKETGVLQRLYDGLVNGMKDIVRNSGPGNDSTLLRDVQGNLLTDFVKSQSSISIINRDLLSLNSLIAKEEKVLIGKENRYWTKFTEMEKALTKMNQQSSWLMQQLGFGG